VLKTDPVVFDAVRRGEKTFEIRKDDRGFAVGDLLVLHKTQYTGAEMQAGSPLVYVGPPLRRRVTHLLRGPVYGLAEGWVILSLGEEDCPTNAGTQAKAMREFMSLLHGHKDTPLDILGSPQAQRVREVFS
jgi:hypothetical protein